MILNICLTRLQRGDACVSRGSLDSVKFECISSRSIRRAAVEVWHIAAASVEEQVLAEEVVCFEMPALFWWVSAERAVRSSSPVSAARYHVSSTAGRWL